MCCFEKTIVSCEEITTWIEFWSLQSHGDLMFIHIKAIICYKGGSRALYIPSCHIGVLLIIHVKDMLIKRNFGGSISLNGWAYFDACM